MSLILVYFRFREIQEGREWLPSRFVECIKYQNISSYQYLGPDNKLMHIDNVVLIVPSSQSTLIYIPQNNP